MAQLKAIAAMALNRTIGFKQQLPWHISEELKHFRATTLNQTLLMGRKTFESMGSRPLPHRQTYILSTRDIAYEGVKTIHSINELDSLDDTVWICGGAQIYEQFLPLCSELLLSVIQKEFEGDVFFPPFEHLFTQKEILKRTDSFEIQRWIRKN